MTFLPLLLLLAAANLVLFCKKHIRKITYWGAEGKTKDEKKLNLTNCINFGRRR